MCVCVCELCWPHACIHVFAQTCKCMQLCMPAYLYKRALQVLARNALVLQARFYSRWISTQVIDTQLQLASWLKICHVSYIMSRSLLIVNIYHHPPSEQVHNLAQDITPTSPTLSPPCSIKPCLSAAMPPCASHVCKRKQRSHVIYSLQSESLRGGARDGGG